MPSGFKKYLPVWLIGFIATIAIAFLLPVERGDAFNIVYYVLVFTFAVQLLIAYFAFKNKDNAVSQTSFIYSIVGIAMIFATTFFIIKKMIFYRPWLMTVIYIIVLALHYFFLIALSTSLNKNVERDEHVRQETNIMLTLTNDVKKLYDSTNNKDIYRLYEALKYSDKKSKDLEVEEQLVQLVNDLKSINNIDEIKNKVDEIVMIIKNK